METLDHAICSRVIRSCPLASAPDEGEKGGEKVRLKLLAAVCGDDGRRAEYGDPMVGKSADYGFGSYIMDRNSSRPARKTVDTREEVGKSKDTPFSKIANSRENWKLRYLC